MTGHCFGTGDRALFWYWEQDIVLVLGTGHCFDTGDRALFWYWELDIVLVLGTGHYFWYCEQVLGTGRCFGTENMTLCLGWEQTEHWFIAGLYIQYYTVIQDLQGSHSDNN